MNIATFLINLDGSDERLASATAQLDEAGISFTRLSAFDGRGLDLSEVADYDGAAAMAYMGRPLRGGEIGCYYSHLGGARQFLESGADYGLVLEDDMRLAAGAHQTIRDMLAWVKETGIDWDVINIGADRLKYVTHLTTANSHELLHAHYFPMTTTGLIWSRKGAATFVNEHCKIFAPVDNFLREWQCIQDRGLSVAPPLVTTIGAESEIDGGTIKRKSEGRSAFYGWRKQKRIIRNKFRALLHKRRYRLAQSN